MGEGKTEPNDSYVGQLTSAAKAAVDELRAGTARSGANNRTLTPFDFQAEERSFWAAPSMYMEMSPFTHADKVNEPLLLVHGAADENQGTSPMQSGRLFEALQGLGAIVRLVLLRAETHGYRARESALHTLWEMTGWLDRHVKRSAPRKGPATPVSTR